MPGRLLMSMPTRSYAQTLSTRRERALGQTALAYSHSLLLVGIDLGIFSSLTFRTSLVAAI
jgi:hypothetical protein